MRVFKKIDGFINGMTMYRAVLYCLLFLFASAFILSFFNWLAFGPLDLVLSTAFIVAVCVFSNGIFAWAFNAPTNIDSVYITALIIALIINPAKPAGNLIFMAWVSVIAMASKYILAAGKKHIFNPAAISVVLVSIASGQSASWWIANIYMMPFVIVGGLFIIWKIKRFDMVLSFLVVFLLTVSIFDLIRGYNLITGLKDAVVYSPMLFFAFIMLTEPMTMPHKKLLRIVYSILVGFLFAPQVHIGPLYFSPELALVAGNFFAYIVSPDKKLTLTLKKKEAFSADTYDFEFIPDQQMVFEPGQYMEFTLEHPVQDRRGIRRYLTLASSPTEQNIKLGVKFYEKPSSFKKYLLGLKEGQKIIASQLAGDFTLPKNKDKKLVFVAGGIGITPFRSMLKYMLDKNEHRSVVLYYLNKKAADIAYRDVFDKAEKELGAKVIYSIIDIPSASYYKQITLDVPDYKERLFFISGPNKMVNSFAAKLRKIGVSRASIKTDYFPGFS
jgi:ferredoxin-NADP reductase/Na+-translocating ferredoxin:NAD+ oxidoreductase RnfD subunit